MRFASATMVAFAIQFARARTMIPARASVAGHGRRACG
jgi:hypothetical protein